MKKTLFATLAFSALATVSALAQNFNPRVEVENTYEGKIVEEGSYDELVELGGEFATLVSRQMLEAEV